MKKQVALFLLWSCLGTSATVRADVPLFFMPHENGLAGFVDARNEWVIPPQFEAAEAFIDGFAIARMPEVEGWVLIDASGRVVQEGILRNLGRGVVVLAVEGGHRVLNVTNPARLDLVVEQVQVEEVYWLQGVIGVKIDGKWGYMDEDGRMVIPAKFEVARSFSEGKSPVKIDGKMGYIDHLGRWVIQPQYDGAEPFSEGLAVVRLNGNAHYIRHDGSRAFEGEFFSAWPFSEGLGMVHLGPERGTGYIDHSGALVIEPEVRTLSSIFQDGLAKAETGEKTGYITMSGEWAITFDKESFVTQFQNGRAFIVTTERAGWIDRSGNWIIYLDVPPEEE